MAAINLCLEIHQRRDAKNQVSFIFFLLYVFNPFLIFFFFWYIDITSVEQQVGAVVGG